MLDGSWGIPWTQVMFCNGNRTIGSEDVGGDNAVNDISVEASRKNLMLEDMPQAFLFIMEEKLNIGTIVQTLYDFGDL